MATKTEKAQIDLIINGQTANQSLRDLEAAARKAKSELRGLTADSARFKELSGNIANINKELDATRVKAGLAKSSWDKMKESIKTTFIGNLGANLATLGLQKIAGYFTDSFSAAVKLSDQLADVRKTTGMTADEAKRLRTELSLIDTRTSMSDLMDIAKIGGQFGVAKEQILGFVQAVDKTTVALGDEFTGGAEQVAGEMAKLRNIFKDIQTDDVGTDINFISNAINKLAAEGVATGPVVSDNANRIGGYGIQVGLTTGQVLGLSAAQQELGITSERGGTAIVKILQKMLTNSSDFAKIAGMDLGKFKDMLNTDLYGAFIKVMEGSKKLGPNAGLLAGIIKDLELQGAGASEVFSKFGSNTEMLTNKVNLATEALTNTTSITEEFNLRNENLAGSVEKLSKEWNKLMANPAMVGFFQIGIDLARQLVGGLKQVAETVKFNYDILTKGYAETNRIYKENQTSEITAQNAETEKGIYAEQLAVYKQTIAQMTNEQLEGEAAKIAVQKKAQFEYMQELVATGNKEQFYIEAKYSKQLIGEANAIKKVQEARLGETKKGNGEITEEEKRAADKRAKEAKQELDRVYKLQMNYYDDLIKLAEKNRDEELKVLMETNKKKFEEIGKNTQSEVDAALQLMALTAMTKDEQVAAVEQTYLEKMSKVEEGSSQYKLLLEQKNREIADIEKKSADDSVKTEEEKQNAKLAAFKSAASSITDAVNAFSNYMQAQNAIELQQTRSFYNQKKTMLKDQLDKGLISQQEYDTKIIQLNEESESRERQLRREQAQSQKDFAVFEATLKAAVAVFEAIINPFKIPQAIAAGLQAAAIAATPIPEFYTGGWMPGSGNDKSAFPIIAHANEYMVDAKSARDPFVMDTIGLIESAKQRGISPSAANQSSQLVTNNSTVNNYANNANDMELKQLLQNLLLAMNDGLSINFDDETAFKLDREMTRYKRRAGIFEK